MTPTRRHLLLPHAVAMFLALLMIAPATADVPGPQLVFVNKFRTWIGSSERKFRPTNRSGTPIPKHAVAIDPPRLSKFVAGLDSAGHLVTFGGEQENRNIPNENIAAAHGDVYLYDFDRNQWFNETRFTTLRPSARYDHVGWVWDGTLYVHGGVNDTVIGDVWAYRNRTWVEKPKWRLPRLKGHSAEVLTPTGPAYIFGGVDPDGKFIRDMWTVNSNGTVVLQPRVGDVPTPRAYHASASAFTKKDGWIMFIFGGTNGVEDFKDLYAYYEKTKTWRLLNPGFTGQLYSFDGTLLPSVSIPGVSRHHCVARFPTLFCVGGRPLSTPITLEYDFFLHRWVRVHFTNPTRLPPLTSHKLVIHQSRDLVQELLVVGGITGAPTRFTNPDALHRTNFFVDACPLGYINPDLDGKCFKCAHGTGVDRETHPRACLPCLRGTYSDREGRCSKCPIGTYNPYNNSHNVSSCIQCPDGYFTVAEGSWTFSQCKTCNLGFYSLDRRCTPCPPGTYGVRVGQVFMDLGCRACPYGTWADEGQATCLPCAPGTSSGPFLKRQYPYGIQLRNMVSRDTGFTTTGCATTTVPATVRSDQWFQVTVHTYDYGQNEAGTNRINPVRLDYWDNALTLRASYEGNPGVMYYACNSLTPIPTCASVAENVSTPAIGRGAFQQNCDGNYYYTFRLRFIKANTPEMPLTTLRITGDGLRPLVLRFAVISAGFNVEWLVNPTHYATGVPGAFPVQLRALDATMVLDTTITATLAINVQCGTGTPAPQFSVDGGVTFGASRTISFVNGLASVNPIFRNGDIGTNCRFRSATGPSPHPAFTIQSTVRLNFELRTANVSNFGVLRMDATLVDATNAVVLGDSTSIIEVGLAPDPRMRKWVWVKETNRRKNVVAGRASFDLTMFSYNQTGMWGRALAQHISGPTVLAPQNISDRFFIVPANGTMIRLVNDRFPFPTTISANSTFVMEFEIVDHYGQQDTSRSIMTRLVLTECPGASLRMVNSTQFGMLNVWMPFGRAIAHIYIVGPADADACRIGVIETTRPDRTVGFWSPPFAIRTPKRLAHDMCVFPTGCATCPPIEVGSILTVTVSMLSGKGFPVPHDSLHVVRFEVLGNASAAYEVDFASEKRLSKGQATFRIFVRGGSSVPFQFRFLAGKWVTEYPQNITYMTIPTFIANVQPLPPQRVFKTLAYIDAAVSCVIVTTATTSKIVLDSTPRVPTWLPNGERLNFRFLAVNDFGVVDTAFVSPWTLTIQNCNTGIRGDVTWQVIHPVTGLPVAYTGANMAMTNFAFGRGEVTVIGTYNSDTTSTGGVSNCSVVIRSASVDALTVEGFTIHRLFPSCLLCPPGSFSGGGTGVNLAITTFHVGGCIPCMIGTFSSDSGASTEASCQVCPKDYGYNAGAVNFAREGQTSCPQFCSTGTLGQSGGGPCPAPFQRGPTQNLDYGQWGTIGRTCTLAACIAFAACPVGTFRLACSEMPNQAACENPRHNGLCFWNTSAVPVAACQGPYEVCIDCPAGTVQQNNNNAGDAGSCLDCNAGGWSSGTRHFSADNTNIHRERYRCNFPTTDRRCTGTGTGQCWNGTYSPTNGATSNATCLECPKGHYCHQWRMHARDTCGTAYGNGINPCGGQMLNPMCNQGTTCWACPLPLHTIIGARAPTPCPPGTYNNETGRWDPSQCLECPAGTYCPSGTVDPIVTDSFFTQSDDTGKSRPEAVSFYGSHTRVSCTDPATQNAAGYIRDGDFTFYRLQWAFSEQLGAGYVNHWAGSSYRISATTHTATPGSGSLYMNATGNPEVWQRVELKHELPIEMVFRVWIFNRLESRNISKIYKEEYSKWRPFAGFQLRVFRTENYTGDPDDERYYAKSIATDAPTNVWRLLEITFTPPWPIKWAMVNLTTRGWYQGWALMDDVSFRPSHRRICNCSTGFYFNESEPSRKCRPCPPGFACSGGTMIRCVNSWSTSKFAGCQYCRDGWLCDSDGRGRHIPCQPLTMKDSNTETCSPCPLGYACRDGVRRMCNAGKYGDGGFDCIVCHPGYYSPNSGQPEIECKRCPPGWFSVAGRDHCSVCPPNHYSPNGTACYECPTGFFAPQYEATACRSCTGAFLDNYNLTLYRNAPGIAVRVVPRVCEQDFDFKVERVQQLEGSTLGEVEMSRSSPSVIYRAGPVLGVHRFRVFVTSGFRQPEQYATVEVRIDNRAPVAQDDVMTLAHPAQTTVFDLSSLLFNDYDLDKDDIFFASATFGASTYGASNLQISANRKHLTVTLPALFKGPAIVNYRIMDKPATTVAACVAPVCRLSATTAQLTLTALQAPPVARNDSYTVINGAVTSLDVLINDYDPEGDEITISATSLATFGTRPTIRQTCPTCPGTCRGIASCTCALDAVRGKCYPSVGREYFIDYTALTTSCGTDRFSYTIQTRDGESTAWVNVTSTRCFCSGPTPGIDIVFVLDGTVSVSGYAFQLSFVDAVQRRSSPASTMFYGVVQVGVNANVRTLMNTYLDPSAYRRDPSGNRFAYTAGQGLQLARTMKLGSGSPARRTVVVVISGTESEDSVGSGIGALASLGNVHFATISVNGANQQWRHIREFSPVYDTTVVDFASLIGSNGKYVEEIMDKICSI